jgi:large subunit ribosomal protein L21
MLRPRERRPARGSYARRLDDVTYVIIKVGGKQYRVQKGERLLVDRLAHEEGTTFTPTVLFVGGRAGGSTLDPDVTVTAKVLGDVKGPKIRIGKYRRRTGYRRHTGFRASLTQIEIEEIGDGKRRAAKRQEGVGKKAKGEPAPTVASAAEPEPASVSLPNGYDDMTIPEIKDAAPEWTRPMLAAALEYEQAHAKRKGAIAVLESTLADKEGDS